MIWIPIVSVLVILIVTAFIIMRKMGGGKFPWIQFYTKGKEAGFNFKEINLLRKVAVDNRLENPTSLFWSIRQLDRSIRGVILKFRYKGKEEEPTEINFVSKLYEFRKKIEFALPKYNLGLRSTRNVNVQQRLKIVLPGVGGFQSQVVEVLRKYLAIAYPQGKVPAGFNWTGQKINVYFWRADDAGYSFATKVIEDFSGKKFPILHIGHSDAITRKQKRRSVRVKVSAQANIFPLKNLEFANEIYESGRGLRSKIVDVSEDGAALVVGGKGKVGMPLKMQFTLNDTDIVMNGVVRGVSFNQKKNQSTLHIQASSVSNRMKNRILQYVYNIFKEQEFLVRKA